MKCIENVNLYSDFTENHVKSEHNLFTSFVFTLFWEVIIIIGTLIINGIVIIIIIVHDERKHGVFLRQTRFHADQYSIFF